MKNANEPKIVWQKWNDPITQFKDQIQQINRQQKLNNFFENEGYNPLEENHPSMLPTPSITSFPMISTPMGLIPAPIPDMSTFNFWIGHTNFNITKTVMNIIENTIGVETLDLFSPYRFRISVGQAFDDNVIKNQIFSNICKCLKNAQKKNDFSA